MRKNESLYAGHRFPIEIVSHAVWLYYRFSLSFRDVEEMLAARGVSVTYESIRHWCLKFGLSMAAGIRRRQGRLGDTWHLDEVFVSIKVATSWISWCRGREMGTRPRASSGRERQMRRFKSAGHMQRFLAVHGPIHNVFRVGRHLMKAKHCRIMRERAFCLWDEVTCAQIAG